MDYNQVKAAFKCETSNKCRKAAFYDVWLCYEAGTRWMSQITTDGSGGGGGGGGGCRSVRPAEKEGKGGNGSHY